MAQTGSYGYRLESGGRLEIEGLKEVQRDLRALSKDSRDDMKDTHRKAGEIIAVAAKPLAPNLTGRLSSTIVSAPTQRQGRVRIGRGQSVPYAGPIHFGWPARRIKPQPFIYEALDGRRDEVLKVYEQRMDQLIRKHDLAPGQRPTNAG
jgi:HK97 gp10 family phage protein